VLIQKKGTELNVLDALISAANATQDMASILDQSLAIVLDALDGHVGGVYLCAESGEGWHLMAQRNLQDYLSDLQRIDRTLPCWGVLCQQRPTAWNVIGAGILNDALAAAGIKRALTVPIPANDETRGCLFVDLPASVSLEPADEPFLHAVGRAIGLAVENARLYDQMARRLRESEARYQVSRAVVSTFDLDRLRSLIVHSAVNTISKADNCVLHLLDEKTGELQAMALTFVDKRRSDDTGRSRMRAGRGIAGIALETGMVVNVPDVENDPRFVRSENVRRFASMMVAPIRLGERRIGTLSVDSRVAFAFSPNDERLVMTLASQAAAAIENARLVQDLQQSLQNLKATQAQLIQSEKLSAIGQLIAGVAHELNNPLTAVMGYTQLLQADDSIDEETRHDLGKIYLQAQRAAKIVQNLLTFARQHKAERQFVDINEILQRTLELRTYQLRVDNIEVVTHLADRVLGAMADPNQLQQVFLNLINNAQDAMTEHQKQGKLTIATEAQGGKIRIIFTDTGPGLAPEAQQHLFEPFFTTKEVGKGTGLGLSICFGIISQHGGVITAESELGKGATFIVELPLVENPRQAWRDAEEIPVPVTKSRLVLVVEDEEDVASFLKRALVQDGHRVLMAKDGETALAHLSKARTRGAHFDLIISDIKMPGLNGPTLYERIAQEDPELTRRMIFTTGDTLNVNTQEFLQRANLPHLAKPFTIDELRRMMVKVLDEAVVA